MGTWVAKRDAGGWVGLVPLVVAAVLWLAVLVGVASPLGRWVGETQTLAQLSKDRAASRAEGVEQPCVGAALRSFAPRR